MMHLPKSLDAWNTPAFNNTLVQEILAQDFNLLPLQQGLTHGAYALVDELRLSVIGVTHDGDTIKAKASLFYTSAIPGCNCADDPTPEETYNEYCELLFRISAKSAITTIELMD